MGDPTCGSGRLLLAYHAHNPENYLVGEEHQPDLLHDDRMQHAYPRMCRGSDLS